MKSLIAALIMMLTGMLNFSCNSNTQQKVAGMSSQEMADRLEIQDLLVRYCYAVDDRNWDTYRTIFTKDAINYNVPEGFTF